MRRIAKGLLVCMLCVVFTGCGKDTNVASDAEVNRISSVTEYEENEIDVPESDYMGMDGISVMTDEEGLPTMFITGEDDSQEAADRRLSMTFYEYFYDMENDSWEERELECAEALAEKAANSYPYKAVMGTDGRRYFFTTKYNGEAGEDWNEMLLDFSGYRENGAEVEEIQTAGMEKEGAEQTMYASTIIPCDDETILYGYEDGTAALYDVNSGEKIIEYEQAFGSRVFVFDGNIFYASKDKNEIQVIDKNTGELLSSIPATVTSSGLAMCMNVMGDIFYLIEDGIYQVSDDYSTSECIVKGSGFKEFLMSTEVSISNLVEYNGEFLGGYLKRENGNNHFKLYRYTTK